LGVGSISGHHDKYVPLNAERAYGSRTLSGIIAERFLFPGQIASILIFRIAIANKDQQPNDDKKADRHVLHDFLLL
jgi:hypothetical protein